MATARSILRFTTLALSAAAIGGGLTLYNYRPYSPIITPVEAVAGTLTLDGSTSGSASFAGNITGASLIDANNNTYYVDPNGATSALFSGKVGIGTTSPQGALTVIGGTTGGTGYAVIGTTGCGTTYTGIGLAGTAISGNCNSYNILSAPTDPTLYINRPTGYDIRFREDNSDQMAIDTGGNVGIGSTAPNSKIDIVSSSEAPSTTGDGVGGNLRLSIGTAVTDESLFFGVNSGGYSWIQAIDPGNAHRNLVLNSEGGYVGIGTTTPQTKFVVSNGAASDGLEFHPTGGVGGSSAFIQAYNRSGSPSPYYDLGLFVEDMYFWSENYGAGVSMTITSTGKVGINTTSPATALNVSGTSSPFNQLTLTDTTSGGTTYVHRKSGAIIEFYNSANGAYAGAVNTTGAYYSSSDSRLKKDITTAPPALDKIMKLRPITYHSLKQSQNDPVNVGFVAQEVAKIFPEAVVENSGNSGYLGLTYQYIFTYGISAIQEQQRLIDKQQTQIQAQQTQIDDLQTQINELKKLIHEK